ncbi:MAG: HEPN domain-containing protein [Deltaproteobacteria bacterium]|nr:HEPN domain-containing protein [Deltaproteobacteria bacterium]
MQSLHLIGQSIELALKAYILSCGEKPKEIHDIVKLAVKAEQLDFVLKQIEASSIVLLNHYFFRDLSTQTKFKTRYPTDRTEMVDGPIPDIKVVKGLVESLISKANKKCQSIDLSIYI